MIQSSRMLKIMDGLDDIIYFFNSSDKLPRSSSPSSNRSDRVDRERDGRIHRCDRERKDRPEYGNQNDRAERCTDRADYKERVARTDHVDRIDHADRVDRIPRDRFNCPDFRIYRSRPDSCENEDWDRPPMYRSSQRYCDKDSKIRESGVDESPTR